MDWVLVSESTEECSPCRKKRVVEIMNLIVRDKVMSLTFMNDTYEL